MKIKLLKNVSILVWITFLIACNNPVKKGKSKTEQIYLKLIAGGLTAPVAMECPGDGSGRLFICEQDGKIMVIKNGQLLSEPFLDISGDLTELNKRYSEKGLLGLAFHPDYKTNGRFFIYYSASDSNRALDHKGIVAEYKVSDHKDKADPVSGKMIMQIAQPEENHNGGQLAFGPDGMLYIGSGDGGGAGDQHGISGNGQNMRSLLGKILRIDVDSKYPYAVPADNPFLNDQKKYPEIWSYGLRNPWRFSFDTETGNLFCGDVGQNEWEEVDIVQKGKNYGWRLMEGNHCFNPTEGCDSELYELPIAEYNHKIGICIIGGYVYRGKTIGPLVGKYIFGDWNGKLFYLEKSAEKWLMKDFEIPDLIGNDFSENINSFGEDEAGEIYLLSQKSIGPFEKTGSVYMIAVH